MLMSGPPGCSAHRGIIHTGCFIRCFQLENDRAQAGVAAANSNAGFPNPVAVVKELFAGAVCKRKGYW